MVTTEQTEATIKQMLGEKEIPAPFMAVFTRYKKLCDRIDAPVRPSDFAIVAILAQGTGAMPVSPDETDETPAEEAIEEMPEVVFAPAEAVQVWWKGKYRPGTFKSYNEDKTKAVVLVNEEDATKNFSITSIKKG